MDSLARLDGTNGVLEPVSVKGPALQNITALEGQKLKALKSDCEDQVDPLELVSCTTEREDKNLSNGRQLCPSTPSLDSDSVDTSSASDQTEDSEIHSASQTPSENLFDPFAPGSSEEMALAPNPKKKIMWETKMSLRRRLIFDFLSDSEEETVPNLLEKEDSFLESICQSFLELIVSNQAKEISIEYSKGEDNSSDGTGEDNSSEVLKTPTSLPLSTGIADTCPAAPARSVLKSRRLDHTICRKLEFGSNLL